jgi:hypothetical protein
MYSNPSHCPVPFSFVLPALFCTFASPTPQEMYPPKISVALIATLLHIRLSSALSSSSSTSNASVITSETYFYGQSPPVYPSPNGTGVGDWKAAYAKADAFVSQLSFSEKVCRIVQAVKTLVRLNSIQWLSVGLVRSTLY